MAAVLNPPHSSPGSDLADEHPLYRQVYLRLREAILSGSLRAGQRLPSTRSMASQMGMARNTILQAFSRLEMEGYIQAQRGSGHYVAQLVSGRGPESSAADRPAHSPRQGNPAQIRNTFSFVPASLRQPMRAIPFRINHPALDHFPIEAWAKLQARVLRESTGMADPHPLLGETEAQGDRSLRQAISDHISIARGVRCGPDDIVITAGAQHAMDLLFRVLTAPGDAVGLEDPCFPGALSAAHAAGCAVLPIPVDRHGIDIALPPDPSPRLLIVCPSKQFPLGMTMSLQRRLALIQWAQRSSAWIIEDDYDSEYRFDGKPIPSLQGLDGGGNVIYVGTFSKVMFPSLRTGFIVAPPALLDALSAARAVSGRHGSMLEQRVLARFIDTGCLARHIKKMRVLYRDRQAELLEHCRRRLHGRLHVEEAQSGLQTVGWLEPGKNDRVIADLAQRHGLETAPLSRFTLRTARAPGLVLGFGGFNSEQIRNAVERMAALSF